MRLRIDSDKLSSNEETPFMENGDVGTIEPVCHICALSGPLFPIEWIEIPPSFGILPILLQSLDRLFIEDESRSRGFHILVRKASSRRFQ